MTDCSNLFLLSSIACKLTDCLQDEEIAILSADLMTLGDMLASILARKTAHTIPERKVQHEQNKENNQSNSTAC